MALWRLIFISILPVCFSAPAPQNSVMKMETFIELLQNVELIYPETYAMDLTKILLNYVHDQRLPSQPLSDRHAALVQAFLSHSVKGSAEMGWHEQGVVLAPDGSSVALRSLLDSLVWGWRTQCIEQNIESSEKMSMLRDTQTSQTSKIYPMTLSSLLGSAYANHKASQTLYIPNGCWDSISSPKSFQLQDIPTIKDLTLAIVNGALDGSLLREMLTNKTQKLSDLLQSYYGSKPTKSPYRRQNFQALLETTNQLEEEIQKKIACCRKHISGSSLPYITDDELKAISTMAANQFEQKYLECPAVIPRCMWEAKPYKGTPTLLHPPLQNIYIHHTHTPSSPCLSFEICAADMRSMQNFHQEDRGWDDIGYSFVAGSDGYLYEGRGWLWVGAHTKGHNTDGYGVSFIGDFTALIPEGRILSLVKDRFLKCGVRSGYIASNFSIQGHRQVVATSCPGDALFQEISTWKNFKATKTSKKLFSK